MYIILYLQEEQLQSKHRELAQAQQQLGQKVYTISYGKIYHVLTLVIAGGTVAIQ